MSNRFFKAVPKRTDPGPSQAEIRRAKDFWADIFEATLTAQIDESSTGHAVATDLVRLAAEIADVALIEMEKRWGKI